jgi:DICT domain-containing protein
MILSTNTSRGNLKLNNPFHNLIGEVRALDKCHNPNLLLEDLHMDTLDGEYHFTTSRDTLVLMSRIIEDTLRLHRKQCSLYAGFQELSRFMEYHEKYARLAGYANQIFVIGTADASVKKVADNVHILTENADIVREYWISVVTNDTIHISLIAEEVPSLKRHGKYMGFYTNSKTLTERVLSVLKRENVLSNEVDIGKQTFFEL